MSINKSSRTSVKVFLSLTQTRFSFGQPIAFSCKVYMSQRPHLTAQVTSSCLRRHFGWQKDLIDKSPVHRKLVK